MENNVKCKRTLLNCYIVTLLWIERNRHSRLAGEAGPPSRRGWSGRK